MIEQYVAAACSFTGLVGVYNKQAWGPALCGVASTMWMAITLRAGMYPYATVEAAYAAINFVIAYRWSQPWPPMMAKMRAEMAERKLHEITP